MTEGKFVITAQCSYCHEYFNNYNPNSEPLKEDEMCFSLELDFKNGRMSFVCPSCSKMNVMEFVSNENVIKKVNLPNIRGMRG